MNIVTDYGAYRPYSVAWQAYSDEWDEGMPVGQGHTEQAAIDDLLEQMEEKEQS